MLDVRRKELKYPVCPAEAARLKRRLGIFMQQDAHNGTEGYMVRSLYFDTLQDSDFEDKVEGYDNRRKIRLRVYDADAQAAKLELKEKNDIYQRKRSLNLSREEAKQMIRGDYSFLLQRDEKLAKWLYVYMTSYCYRPKCVVEYDRFAFMLQENDTRVTFDRNIRASESCFDIFRKDMILYPVCRTEEITMEVKYNEFLMTFVKNELGGGTNRVVQYSNSKYCRARMVSKKGRR